MRCRGNIKRVFLYSCSTCVVNQIRIYCKYVGSKHQKEFLKDLKKVYQAVNKDTAEFMVDNQEMKWESKRKFIFVIKVMYK